MTPAQTVAHLLADRPRAVRRPQAQAWAPANIALCKYWGKRAAALHLPVTDSLSVTLGALGATTSVRPAPQDHLILNDQPQPPDSPAARRLTAFLDLFRTPAAPAFRVASVSTVPIAAGLASSACGFAALVLALDQLFAWELPPRALSILARLGSGSACRSLTPGFAWWHAGQSADGLDSYAETLTLTWPALRLGWLEISRAPKAVSSRAAMARTVATSPLYPAWPAFTAQVLETQLTALRDRDLTALGATAEQHALAMHATLLAAWPPGLYWQPETVAALHQVWRLRHDEGIPVYVTMDAGPNLKLIFEAATEPALRAHFPALRLIAPFAP